MAEIRAEAPDFADSQYPNAGQQIGPAWRAAWRVLRDGREHTVTELAAEMCQAGGIQDRTARNLLRQARACGILAKRVGAPPRPGARYGETIYVVSAALGGGWPR